MNQPTDDKDIQAQRQEMIINFIRIFREIHGISPTDREIAIGIGYSENSFGSVHTMITPLIEAGWLRKVAKGGRTLVPCRNADEVYYPIHTRKLKSIYKRQREIAQNLI